MDLIILQPCDPVMDGAGLEGAGARATHWLRHFRAAPVLDGYALGARLGREGFESAFASAVGVSSMKD